ncbi:hypothetical protein EMCRGX_G024361 [Ephydatia muelleri]
MNLIGFIQVNETHSSKELRAVIEYGGACFFTNSSCSEAITTELLLLLPHYLVPSLYVFTYKLPTLSSGKVSQKELPPSEIKRLFSESVSESIELSNTEQQLCYMFCEFLKLTNVSHSGKFFSLGGNSLSAIDLASSIQEYFHCEVSVATIVANPTMQSLALVIDKNATEKVLTFESFEFTSLLALAFVVKDCSTDCPLGFHDSQIILPSFEFDLIHGPLWRFTLFTNVFILGEKECCSVIAFQAHHIMTDGWSIHLLTADLEKIYTRLCNGEANVFPAPNPSTFLFAIKHAIAERSKSIDKQLQLWRTKFSNALLPPFFHPKCLRTCTYNGSAASVIHKSFAVSMSDIRSLCQANGTSEFVPVSTGLLAAIYALNGNTDVLASLVLAFRNSENAMIPGCNVDSFPLRVIFDETVTLQSLLPTVKAGTLEVMENQISWYQLEKTLMKRGNLMPDSSFSSGVLNHTDALDVHVAYSSILYHAETVQMLLDTWEGVLETMVKHVYLNVPLKRLCSDIFISSHEEASNTQEKGLIGCDPFQLNSEPEGIAISLNASTDDVVTWSHFLLIQKALVHFMSSCCTLSGNNRPIVLVHLPFSAFSIALIAAVTRLEYGYAFCSSLDGIVSKIGDMSKNCSSCLVVVRNNADSEQIKKLCNAINFSVVPMESFDSNLLFQVSTAPSFDFTVDYTKWQSDILTSLKVLNTYFTDAVMHKAITLTSPGSSTLAIAVTLVHQGIPVQAYTFDHTISFVEASWDTGVDMILIQEITVPSILPKIVECRTIKHLWIQGLPLGLAYISYWMAASQHMQVIVTHSLMHEHHLITHHLNLKDIPSIEDGSIPCIPIGRMCQGLNGKVLHRDGREVYQGFVGNFATVNDSQVYRSTSLVRQLPKDGTFELVSVNAEAYYKAIDVTPALFVLSTIPEVSWCGVAQGNDKGGTAIIYATHTDSSERAPLHRKISQQLISTLSLAYAGLVHQLPEPPPITNDVFTSVNQIISTDVPHLHWLYSDPALSHLNDHTLSDKIVELVSKSLDTDPDTVRQTCDLLCIGGNSTAFVLSLTVGLNAAFNAGFTVPAVYQAVHDGCLISLVVDGGMDT